MFEPPLINQLLGTGAVILGFISAGILVHQMEKQEEEERINSLILTSSSCFCTKQKSGPAFADSSTTNGTART